MRAELPSRIGGRIRRRGATAKRPGGTRRERGKRTWGRCFRGRQTAHPRRTSVASWSRSDCCCCCVCWSCGLSVCFRRHVGVFLCADAREPCLTAVLGCCDDVGRGSWVVWRVCVTWRLALLVFFFRFTGPRLPVLPPCVAVGGLHPAP